MVDAGGRGRRGERPLRSDDGRATTPPVPGHPAPAADDHPPGGGVLPGRCSPCSSWLPPGSPGTPAASYFVGLSGDRIIIYQGRPGGVLWFRPTVADATEVTTADVVSRHLPALSAGQQEPSLDAARQFVTSMVDRKAGRPAGAPRPPTHHSPTEAANRPPQPPGDRDPRRTRPAADRAGSHRAGGRADRWAVRPRRAGQGRQPAGQHRALPRDHLRPAARRPPGHAPAGAQRRSHPAADGGTAQRNRLRVHRPPVHPRGPPAGGVDGARDRRLRRHPGSSSGGPGISSATATASPSPASRLLLLPLAARHRRRHQRSPPVDPPRARSTSSPARSPSWPWPSSSPR